MVESTLSQADATKRCYRKVGDVLVERTVKEVLPAVQKNKEMVRVSSSASACALRLCHCRHDAPTPNPRFFPTAD
jgi:hypothetical protein